MGVKGLWKLLQPCGRRVSIETIRGKTLAIDASIWLVQFLKAMRDSEGQMLPNAHVLGVLRRVLKLFFHGIKPIFVFDGGAPVLKKRTLLRRAQRREAQGAKLQRTAHKFLALQLREHREKQRLHASDRAVGGNAAGFRSRRRT